MENSFYSSLKVFSYFGHDIEEVAQFCSRVIYLVVARLAFEPLFHDFLCNASGVSGHGFGSCVWASLYSRDTSPEPLHRFA
jgi:hypothetical protein